MKKLVFDPLNIVICGMGGQGNVLASEILANAMNDAGYKVAVGETYGAAQRGGSVMSHVRVSKKIDMGVLIPSKEAHIIIGFEPLETLRMVRKYAGKETFVVYDNRVVYPLGVLTGEQIYPDLSEMEKEIAETCAGAYAIPAADIAIECGDAKAANIVLLGAFSALPKAPLNSKELEEIIALRFKGSKALDVNLKAFARGCEAVKEAK